MYLTARDEDERDVIEFEWNLSGAVRKAYETMQKRAKNDAERLKRERQGRRKRLPGSLALLPKPVSVCYGLKKTVENAWCLYILYIRYASKK